MTILALENPMSPTKGRLWFCPGPYHHVIQITAFLRNQSSGQSEYNMCHQVRVHNKTSGDFHRYDIRATCTCLKQILTGRNFFYLSGIFRTHLFQVLFKIIGNVFELVLLLVILMEQIIDFSVAILNPSLGCVLTGDALSDLHNER